MAKKKKRLNTKVKPVVAKVPLQKEKVDTLGSKDSPGNSFFKTAYTLNVIVGVFVLITALLFTIFPAQFSGFSLVSGVTSIGLLCVLDIVVAVALLISAGFMKINVRQANIFVLLFNIIALILPPHGFGIGPLIGIINSIVVLAKFR